jgi:hypothetical protein
MHSVSIPPKYRTYAPIVAHMLQQADSAGLQTLAERMLQHHVDPPASFFIDLLVTCCGHDSRTPLSVLDWALEHLARVTDHLPLEGPGQQLADTLPDARLTHIETVELPVAEHSATAVSTQRMRRAGVCKSCGGQLQAIGLSFLQRSQLRSAIMGMAGSDAASKALALADFAAYMTALHEPPTVVVDGPNVAYHGQNQKTGYFSFGQVSSA